MITQEYKFPKSFTERELSDLSIFEKAYDNPDDAFVVQQALEILADHVEEMEEQDYLMFFQNKLGGVTVDLHLEWWDIIKASKHVCILAPRNSGKSFFFVIGYILWNMYYRKHRLIYLISDSQDQAIELLKRVKDIIENTETLKWLRPSDPDTWSKMEIESSNGVRVKTKGFGSAIRGPHPGLIVLDDVLNDTDPMTQNGRIKAEKYFKSAVSNMLAKQTKSQLIIVGTAQHYKDLLHILEDNEAYVWKRYKAVLNFRSEAVLMPERWSYAELMIKKKEIGSLAFAKEYQNEPIDEESTIFPWELMRLSYDENFIAPIKYNGAGEFRTYIGVDFSVPGSSGGDWTVVLTLGVDRQNNYYLFDIWRGRGHSFTEQLSVVIDRCERFSVTRCFMEDNMFQRIYATVMAEISAAPVYGHTVTSGGKKSLLNGVPSMVVLFENLKMVLPYSKDDERGRIMTDSLAEELHSFRMMDGKLGTVSDHDDIVMAYWHAYCASKDVIKGAGASKSRTPILKTHASIGQRQQDLSDLARRGYRTG